LSAACRCLERRSADARKNGRMVRRVGQLYVHAPIGVQGKVEEKRETMDGEATSLSLFLKGKARDSTKRSALVKANASMRASERARERERERERESEGKRSRRACVRACDSPHRYHRWTLSKIVTVRALHHRSSSSVQDEQLFPFKVE